MPIKQITFSIVLFCFLINHYTYTMDQPSNSIVMQPATGEFFLRYPAFNDYTNAPELFEKKFKSVLILHLYELECRGKKETQLKRFEEIQLKSMERQKQKITANLTASPLKTGCYPQQRSIEPQKQS